MTVTNSSVAAPATGPSTEGGAVDIHTHAMPLPLLQQLAERGLADLDGVPDGVVRLDPAVSGVGPGAPLPLARSQYDVAVRLSEMDGVGVHHHAVSLPPFLFCSTADDRRFVADIVAAACWDSGPSHWAGPAPQRKHAVAWTIWVLPASRSAAGAAAGISTTR